LAPRSKAEAEKLLQAKNDANVQPILSRELAKVYMHAQDPQFAGRTWGDVARIIDFAYEGNTKTRFQKFLKSHPVQRLMDRKLMTTTSTDFMEVFAHPRAGVSTNVQLRILHMPQVLRINPLRLKQLRRKARTQLLKTFSKESTLPLPPLSWGRSPDYFLMERQRLVCQKQSPSLMERGLLQPSPSTQGET
jgi:hypothetical protein